MFESAWDPGRPPGEEFSEGAWRHRHNSWVAGRPPRRRTRPGSRPPGQEALGPQHDGIEPRCLQSGVGQSWGPQSAAT
eukprot:8080407-Pyramimonas_sp.AAC.1